MTPLLVAIAASLHALATVVFIGYYLLLSLLFLPVLGKAELDGGSALGRLSKSSRSWQYASLLVLALTGAYLTIADSNYGGLGNFGSPWAVLMLLKHIAILAMVTIGFWGNFLQRVGQRLRSNPGDEAELARYRRYANAMAICGVIVLVLTAIAQIE
jgi:uncharacterized membrane protein